MLLERRLSRIAGHIVRAFGAAVDVVYIREFATTIDDP